MKSLQELYTEIMGSDELKKAFAKAAKSGKVTEFLKAHGCETTEEDIKTFLKEKADQPLSDEELDSVAGGDCNPSYGQTMEAGLSIATFGIGCATLAIYSAASGHTGREKEDENLICNPDK